MQLTTQINNIFATLDQTCPKHAKRDILHSLFNFMFCNPNRSGEINAIKNNMAILRENQDILSSQIEKKHSIIHLTYAETVTYQLLFKSLQKDMLQITNTFHHLSKKLKALYDNRNFFIIMFQLRRHLANLCNRIKLVRIDIISILNHVDDASYIRKH